MDSVADHVGRALLTLGSLGHGGNIANPNLGCTGTLWQEQLHYRVFELFASAMLGGMTANYFMGGSADVFGALAGMSAFACARLWLAAPAKNSNLDTTDCR